MSPRRRPLPADPRGRSLITADGIRINADHVPKVTQGRGVGAAQAEREIAFVVAHGFTGTRRRLPQRIAAEPLRGTGAVITFDFRGHGRSGGHSSVGDREVLDLDAAVGWARLLGYRRVVTLGWSMGAAVVIRHAALRGGLDAVVAVSSPSRWRYRGTPPMQMVHWAIGTRAGRAVTAGALRTRISARGWDPVPEPPDAVIGRIAPTPLLIVHGDADHYFPLEHALWLARAAREPAELWIEPGFRHAEGAASADLVRRIAAWARRACDTSVPGASAKIPA